MRVTPGSVTYDLVLTRNSSYPSNSSVLNWSVASLPTGATATFAPVGGWNGTTRAYTMTISTTAATPVWHFDLHVRVNGSVQPAVIASAPGALVVQVAVQAAQTISFGRDREPGCWRPAVRRQCHCEFRTAGELRGHGRLPSLGVARVAVTS